MARKKVVQDRREHIIEAADRLFNHYGYGKTTMQDISREADIPRATLYLEFPGGKDDILMASLRRQQDRLLVDMRQMVRASRNGRLETLRQLILCNLLSSYDTSTRQAFGAETIYKNCQRFQDELAGFINARNELFSELFRQADMAGEIATGHDHGRLTELVVQGMISYFPPACFKLSREQLSQDAGAFFSLFLSGLAGVRQQRPLTAALQK